MNANLNKLNLNGRGRCRGRGLAQVGLLVLMALAVSFRCFGANATLAWDQSAETNIVYYRIYSVTNGVTNAIWVPFPTNAVTLSNLIAGVSYTFSATAQNAQGLESLPSNSIQYTPPVPMPAPTAPTIRSAALGQWGSTNWYLSGSWSLASNALGYGYRLTATNGWVSAIAFTTNTAVAVFAPSMPVRFEVWATNATGSSEIASMQFARPAPIAGLRVADSTK